MTERQSALLEILSMPDPDDLEPRVHQLTVEGKPDRFETYRDLPIVYAHQKREQKDEECLTRVAPPVNCVGESCTAERPPGAVIAAERTE